MDTTSNCRKPVARPRLAAFCCLALVGVLVAAGPASAKESHFGEETCNDAGLTSQNGFRCFTLIPGVYCWYETALLEVVPEDEPEPTEPDDPGCSVRIGPTWVAFDIFGRDSEEIYRYGSNIEVKI